MKLAGYYQYSERDGGYELRFLTVDNEEFAVRQAKYRPDAIIFFAGPPLATFVGMEFRAKFEYPFNQPTNFGRPRATYEEASKERCPNSEENFGHNAGVQVRYVSDWGDCQV